MPPRRAGLALVAGVALLATTCSLQGGQAPEGGEIGGVPPPASSTPFGSADRGAATPVESGPLTTRAQGPRAAPAASRPVVSLAFDVNPAAGRASGTQRVVFTPDRRVCELVFRLWPNKPELARAGTSLVVRRVAVDGRARSFVVQRAGGLDRRRGTLLDVPLARCVDGGRSVTAELSFQLVLGPEATERTGYSPRDGTAYLATAFPLLAWERGRGWMRTPAVDLFGEMAGSEVFRLAELRIVAPRGYVVMGTGSALGAAAGPRAGTTVHRFRAAAVRDVTVAVGRYAVVEREVAGVRLHVGVPTRGSVGSPEKWADRNGTALTALAGLFGPFAYTDLWVTVVPQIGTGIEFPGAIFYGDVDPDATPMLVPHEVAHMWFYGLVGNDQGRDPWLDEAFATYAEALVTGGDEGYRNAQLPPEVRGQLGQPMSFWVRLGPLYATGVYVQGAAALLDARDRAGAARFDGALREYVDRHAHEIVTPDDLATALAGLPEAVDALRAAGAFVQLR